MSRSEPTKEVLARLAKLVAETADEEIDCGAVLENVAVYLEAVRKGAALTADLAVVAQHMKVCPECFEEFQALSDIPDSEL